MNNNIYIRSNKTIKSISIMHIIMLLPILIYGFYKNGIYLYVNKYINLVEMFKPIYLFFLGGLIGLFVNLIYEKLIKKSNDNLSNIVFSSFHVEYGIIIGMIVSPNVNIIIFSLATFILLFITKFLNNRVNTICLIFLIIYLLSYLIGDYNNYNLYELDKSFNLNTLDYLLGRGVGGISSTSIILSFISLLILHLTNNLKTNISLSAIISFMIIVIIYSITANINFNELAFTNSIIFSFIFVATDSVTSSYTNKGTIIYGCLIGVLTFTFSLLDSVIAPYIAILIVSLFNNLIDRSFYKNRRA